MPWYYWAALAAAAILACVIEAKVRSRRLPPAKAMTLRGDGGYDFEIAGEGSYQHNLSEIAGRAPEGVEYCCAALLQHEPANIHDGNAVCVMIAGLPVGYIRRTEAPQFVAFMGRGSAAICGAVIVGGWDRGAFDKGFYGVKLDLAWPLQNL